MDIKQAQTLKEEIEAKILALIRQLEQETGVEVESVKTDRIYRGVGAYTTMGVRLNVHL